MTRRGDSACPRLVKAHTEKMSDQLDNTPTIPEAPTLIVRNSSLGSLWSVWAVLEGTHSEEIFEGSSEEEVLNWIKTGGQTWLEERRQKRSVC